MPKDFKDLIELQHYDTYHFARIIDAMVREPMAYLRDLSEILSDNDGIVYFCDPFQKDSALHRFASLVINHTFHEDLLTPLTLIPSHSQVFPGAPLYDREMFVLPVENAFDALGLLYFKFSEFRDSTGLPPLEAGFERHVYHAARHPCDDCAKYENIENEYSDYFGELQLTGELEELCDRLAEEVFYVLFANRSFLYDFNKVMASYVTGYATFTGPEEVEPDSVFMCRPDGCSRLKRAHIPRWVETAVEFRERGRCAHCQIELGTLRTPIKRAEYDHMIALADGGLNDVTNIQLLCHVCNNEKGSNSVVPRLLYERWYPA